MKTIFKRNHTFNHIFIGFLAVIIGLARYFVLVNSEIDVIQYHNIVYSFNIVSNLFFIETIICISLLIVLSAYLNAFNSKHSIVEGAFPLPGMIFIALTGVFIMDPDIVPVLTASCLIMVSLDRLFPVYRKPNALSNCFDAGFWPGLALFIYPDSLILFPLIIIVLLYIKPFQLREVILMLLGLALPLIIMLSVFYLTDEWELLRENYFGNRLLQFTMAKYNTANIVFASGVLILGVIALMYYLLAANFKKIVVRRYLAITAFFLIISGVESMTPVTGFAFFLFYLIPLSYMLSNMVVNSKSRFLNAIIPLLIIFILGSYHYLYFSGFII